MTNKTVSAKITLEFNVIFNSEFTTFSDKDLKLELEYVIAEAKTYIDTLEGFRAGIGRIENVTIK